MNRLQVVEHPGVMREMISVIEEDPAAVEAEVAALATIPGALSTGWRAARTWRAISSSKPKARTGQTQAVSVKVLVSQKTETGAHRRRRREAQGGYKIAFFFVAWLDLRFKKEWEEQSNRNAKQKKKKKVFVKKKERGDGLKL